MYKGFICPVCRTGKLNVTFNIHEIPYFGEIMESVALCSGCHYRHTDVISLQEKAPVKYILKVEREEDLNIRVVRSSQCKVEIPELGAEITPGAAADGFISNVEGILNRVEDAVMTSIIPDTRQTRPANGDLGDLSDLSPARRLKGRKKLTSKEQQAARILDKIRRIKEGKEKITLILDDPSGNSAIISDRAEKVEGRRREDEI